MQSNLVLLCRPAHQSHDHYPCSCSKQVFNIIQISLEFDLLMNYFLKHILKVFLPQFKEEIRIKHSSYMIHFSEVMCQLKTFMKNYFLVS